MGPYPEPDSELEYMRELSSATPLNVNFDHLYLTRPELGHSAAIFLAHTPKPLSALSIFIDVCALLLNKNCIGIISILC